MEEINMESVGKNGLRKHSLRSRRNMMTSRYVLINFEECESGGNLAAFSEAIHGWWG